MNSLSRNIKSLQRLTTLVSQDSNAFSTQNHLHLSSNEFIIPSNSQPNLPPRYKRDPTLQMDRLFIILRMVEQQLVQERKNNRILEEELQKSRNFQKQSLLRYKEEVQKEFKGTMGRVLKEEEERIGQIERYYRKRIGELEAENKQYKGDFEVMKGNLEDIQKQFKVYSKRERL